MQRIVYLLMAIVVLSSCGSNKSFVSGDLYSSKNKRESKQPRYVKQQSDKLPKNSDYKFERTDRNTEKIDFTVRSQIVNTASNHIGVKYKPGGRTPDSGFDCSGFTSFIFNKNNIPLNGPSDKQASSGKQKVRNELLPGDLVFFGNQDRISHVAIVVKNEAEKLEVVHATTSAGVKKDEINFSKYWNQKYLFGIDIISEYLEGSNSVASKKP